jgi:gluconate 2-dehydrogenase gamma chain
MRRRDFIVIPARTLGGAALAALAGHPIHLSAQGDARVALRFFSAPEARVVEAAAARIFPADESGPGAREAGVIIYIDRQLAGPYGRDQYRYTKGPWIETVPEHGNQKKDSPADVYRAGVAMLGSDFDRLSPKDQDRQLEAIQTTAFFELLRTHTIEGMFCDPLHGGNAGMVGWQMIGYPGPSMTHRIDIGPMSLEQMVGHPVKGWEDEQQK